MIAQRMSIKNKFMIFSKSKSEIKFITVAAILLLFVGSSCALGASAQSSSNTTGSHTNSTQNSAKSSLPSITQPLKISTGMNQPLRYSLGEGDPNNPNIHFLIKNLPQNGNITGVDGSNVQLAGAPNFVYVPNKGFTGLDSFSFITKNSTKESNPYLVEITVLPNRSSNASYILLSFVIALVAVLLILFVASTIIRKIRAAPPQSENIMAQSSRGPSFKSKFSDIIRGFDMDPSLSIFQFLLWSLVLMFSFIGVYLVRIFAGISDPPQGPLPVYLLSIGGISVATPLISNLISSYRYNSVQFYTDERADTAEENDSVAQKRPLKRPPLGEMLREYGKPTLSRFQMFGWTWISIGIYLSVLFSKVSESSHSVQNLSVPDVDPTLVVLMGLSQFAFLGIKASNSTEIQISRIYPLDGVSGDSFSIFGKNFGDTRQVILLGHRRIMSDDREHLTYWSNDRIDIKIPEDIDPGKCEIMVIKEGLSKIAKEKFTVNVPPASPDTNGGKDSGKLQPENPATTETTKKDGLQPENPATTETTKKDGLQPENPATTETTKKDGLQPENPSVSNTTKKDGLQPENPATKS
jgi:hypothetical protein